MKFIIPILSFVRCHVLAFSQSLLTYEGNTPSTPSIRIISSVFLRIDDSSFPSIVATIFPLAMLLNNVIPGTLLRSDIILMYFWGMIWMTTLITITFYSCGQTKPLVGTQNRENITVSHFHNFVGIAPSVTTS